MPSKEKKKKIYKVKVSVDVNVGPRAQTPYSCLRHTRKDRKKKLKTIHALINALEFLPVYNYLYRTIEVFRHEKSKEEFTNLSYFLEYNEVMQPTIHLVVEEFYTFLVELQVGVYTGAARTLRCIVETAVEACDFQSSTKRPTITELLKEYDSIKQASKKIRSQERIKLMMKHNAWISYLERYKIYEETKRIAPSFRELVNRLNSREFFNEDPSVSENLKTTFERLSDYVHPSSEKIEAQMMKSRRSLFPRFSSETFDLIYELGINVLDMVRFLYISSISRFYGFESANDFLRSFSKQVIIPKDMANIFKKLPHFGKLAKGIVWTEIRD